MTEQILRQVNFPDNYALTQNHPHSRCSLNLGDGDRNLALRKKWFDGSFDDFPTREKIYFKNGDIMHTSAGGAYTALIPQNGTGSFVIYDNGITVKGEMKKGRIAKLNDLYELGSPSRFEFSQLLEEQSSSTTRKNIETVLEMAKKGSLKLQNLTSVILKKVLQFLPK